MLNFFGNQQGGASPWAQQMQAQPSNWQGRVDATQQQWANQATNPFFGGNTFLDALHRKWGQSAQPQSPFPANFGQNTALGAITRQWGQQPAQPAAPAVQGGMTGLKALMRR